jgi:hypothetical protein
MQTSTETTNASAAVADSHQTAYRVYQGLTIAAMLLLLISLWAF